MPRKPIVSAAGEADRLFDEVSAILKAARRQAARSVNSRTVTADWLIGWRIVEAEQSGKPRAGDGKRILEGLPARLAKCSWIGFSVANPRNFREFYLEYPKWLGKIRYTPCSESVDGAQSAGPQRVPAARHTAH